MGGHRRSIRLTDYDYSQEGFYFVTICSFNREWIFGEIKNGEMFLNSNGEIVQSAYLSLSNRFPITLDTYQLMPNHFHGIIIINHAVGAGFPRPKSINAYHPGRGDRAPTLGTILAYFKYQSAKQINLSHHTPGFKLWQRNYFEHIIRSDEEYFAIKQYIQDNPENWQEDKLYVM
jgi:putative transposase